MIFISLILMTKLTSKIIVKKYCMSHTNISSTYTKGVGVSLEDSLQVELFELPLEPGWQAGVHGGAAWQHNVLVEVRSRVDVRGLERQTIELTCTWFFPHHIIWCNEWFLFWIYGNIWTFVGNILINNNHLYLDSVLSFLLHYKFYFYIENWKSCYLHLKDVVMFEI